MKLNSPVFRTFERSLFADIEILALRALVTTNEHAS